MNSNYKLGIKILQFFFFGNSIIAGNSTRKLRKQSEPAPAASTAQWVFLFVLFDHFTYCCWEWRKKGTKEDHLLKVSESRNKTRRYELEVLIISEDGHSWFGRHQRFTGCLVFSTLTSLIRYTIHSKPKHLSHIFRWSHVNLIMKFAEACI